MNILGKRIAQMIEYRGMTQTALANLLGVKCATVSRYISGVSDPSTETLSFISDCLSTSADYLLGRTDIIDMPEEEDEALYYSEMILHHQSLDTYGKAVVDAVLNLEYNRVTDNFDPDDEIQYKKYDESKRKRIERKLAELTRKPT